MRMHYCRQCKAYTLKEACSKCNAVTTSIGPARYSPQDQYGKYRRMMKKQMGEA
ncbi:MAG: RNA-protein complex protein Nop10 [Candidatus Altiarchaeota archaeon]